MAETFAHVLQGAAGGILGTLLTLWIVNRYEERRLQKLAQQLRDERNHPLF